MIENTGGYIRQLRGSCHYKARTEQALQQYAGPFSVKAAHSFAEGDGTKYTEDMYLLLRWVLNALALLLVAYVVPGFHVASFYSALIVALLLGIVNAVIRPVLLLLTLPVTVLTLGLFAFVVNAILLLFVATIVKGFTIDTFASALVGGALLWLIAWATGALLEKR